MGIEVVSGGESGELLLPACPFCGGKGSLDAEPRAGVPIEDEEHLAYFVRCLSCAGQGGWAKTPGNAVRRWVQRSKR